MMRHRQGGTSSIGILSALYYMVKVTYPISIGFLQEGHMITTVEPVCHYWIGDPSS